MDRKDIYDAIELERAYQVQKWGEEFDKKNTPNDWIAYVVQYAGKAVTLPFDRDAFRVAVLKVATLCVAILERDEYAKRHYDK